MAWASGPYVSKMEKRERKSGLFLLTTLVFYIFSLATLVAKASNNRVIGKSHAIHISVEISLWIGDIIAILLSKKK